MPADNNQLRTGLFCALGAYFIWGIFPLYLKAVSDVTALEILAHRILWSVPFGAVIISLRKQWPEVFGAFSSRNVIILLLASSIAIAGNWLVYVWAVINDRILEASLGYYINPLMYVAAGVLVLNERLSPFQTLAITLATMGVLVMTFGAGTFPWVSIVLAILFTAYGYIRKTVSIGAMPGLFVETALLAPAAMIYMVILAGTATQMFPNYSVGLNALLVLAGPVTVIPLVLFALGARRLTLTTLGFLQYIGPTLQFIIGLYYGEAFTAVHAVAFGLIWTALIVFSFDAWRTSRASQAAA